MYRPITIFSVALIGQQSLNLNLAPSPGWLGPEHSDLFTVHHFAPSFASVSLIPTGSRTSYYRLCLLDLCFTLATLTQSRIRMLV